MYRILVTVFLLFLSFPIQSKAVVYVYRSLINVEDVRNWALEQGIASTLRSEDMHVTLAYSKEGLEKENINAEKNYILNADGNYERTLELFGKNQSVLVLKFEESAFNQRWQTFLDLGASWDWPSYQPHITITNQGQDLDLAQITPYHGVLIFGPEIVKEINKHIPKKILEESVK